MRARRLLLQFLVPVVAILPNLSAADSLQQVYELALSNDHQLKSDTAAYRAASEALTIGRAGLLPQISATASISQSSSDSNTTPDSTPSGSGTTDVDTTEYSVTLTQPLFNMAAWFGYQQGKALSDQAKAQLSAAQQDLIIRVAESYFNVLRAIDNLETSKAEEKAFDHQLEQARQRFEVGLTAITDVHEAQAAYDNAFANVIEAQGNLGIAFDQVSVLTGQPLDSIAPLIPSFPVNLPTPKTREEWVKFAISNNYSLKSAELAAEASRQTARASKSAHLPTLTGSLRYSDSDSEFSGLREQDVDDQNEVISIQLNVPLFSGLRTSGERRQSNQRYIQSRELYHQAQRDTIQATRSLHLSVVTNVAQVKARQQAITSSQSALEATQAGYEVGTRNLVDTLVAQRNLYQAQRNYDNTRYDYILNTLRLKAVAGNLTPEDIIELNRWLASDDEQSRSEIDV